MAKAKVSKKEQLDVSDACPEIFNLGKEQSRTVVMIHVFLVGMLRNKVGFETTKVT